MSIELIEGDCRRVMATMRPASIDVVVTSPPFNIGVKYNKYEDELNDCDYVKWLAEVVLDLTFVLKDRGSLFLNLGSKPTKPMLPFHAISRIQGILMLQNVFHWVKSIAVKDNSYGHFKPINSKRFVNDCHEYVFHFTKNGDVPLDRLAIGVPYQDKSNIKRWETKEDNRCRGNTWFIPYKTRRKKLSHPATFPVELPLRCLKLHGVTEGMNVLDPFVGIGTSGVAAKEVGANFWGIDTDLSYLEIAKERLDCGRINRKNDRR